ncbi:Protein disulfide-isomerase A2 [Channa argus]|uniref:protein disulfide-isomerase n=1 Tax=Channa argus TaxID=215402 RepID=A0A6G1PCD0_CHAAH|nr:Protein disulfide-isomerase A2 [Channa argus]
MRAHMLLFVTVLGLLLWASCIQADDEGESTEKHTETQEETSGEQTEETAEDTEEEELEEEPKKEKTTEIEEIKDVMVLHINNFARALSENQYLLVEFYELSCSRGEKKGLKVEPNCHCCYQQFISMYIWACGADSNKMWAEQGLLWLLNPLSYPFHFGISCKSIRSVRYLVLCCSKGRTCFFVCSDAPWCGHCKQLEPVYEEAAEKLKNEEPDMRLAKVDAIEETELTEEFEIDLEGDSAKVLKELAFEMTDVEFAMTAAPEVFQKYEVKGSSVVLFKKVRTCADSQIEGQSFWEQCKAAAVADFVLSEDGTLDKNNLTHFIKDNSLALIIEFKQETSDKIFTSSIRLHSLLFINSTVESQTALVKEITTVAKEFKGKMLFITIDVTAALSHVLTYFGVSESDAPTARLVNMETGKKFNIATGGLTANSLRQLCQEVVDGTAKPYYRTEDIPEDWDKGPVKVLVGKNFESVALDPTKNVFVEFYQSIFLCPLPPFGVDAPWCGHCKELAPIWEQLGEKYSDHENIIIAKMDATANEVESIVIQGFPTLRYFPADSKEVIDYTGKRDLETLSKFLDDGGVLPKEESDEEEDEEEEEDDEDEEEDEQKDKPKEGNDVDDDSKEADDVLSNVTSKDEL